MSSDTMTELKTSIRNTIEEQLGDGEEIKAEYTQNPKNRRNKLFAAVLTDRRAIKATAENTSSKEGVWVGSVFLNDDRIRGVGVRQETNKPWYAWLVEAFGGSVNGTTSWTVTIRSTAKETTFDFDEGGEEIAKAIARQTADSQEM